jgi:hypothetical protein
MVKMLLWYLVGVAALLSSAWVVCPAYATSATVLITHIQAGASGAATQEFIVIYNASLEDVEITGWCLENKKDATVACFNDPDGWLVFLPAGKYAVAASSSFAATVPAGSVTTVYEPASQNSGSITGSSDTVTLFDRDKGLVDEYSWMVPLSGGDQMERRQSDELISQGEEESPVIDEPNEPVMYQDTDAPEDWLVVPSYLPPVNQVRREDPGLVDVCDSLEGMQLTVPLGMEVDELGVCVERVIMRLVISELLPNASGSDIGHEFIEIYNPNDVAVALAPYRLLVGPAYEKWYEFPTGAVIDAGAYISFSNSAIPFTLLNSTSRLALALDDGTILNEVPAYDTPKDDVSWALIGDDWVYTNSPTPDSANIASQEAAAPGATSASTLQPCADNQYRSSETNRCRLIAAQSTQPKPCNADQERNPETNRCRNIVTATTPKPCKEGQERNLTTNRCRTVVKMTTVDYGVLGAETKTSGNWYVLAAMGGVLLVALGYAVWEWRIELAGFFKKVTTRLQRLARPGK